MSASNSEASVQLEVARHACHEHHWLRRATHRANNPTRYYCPSCRCWGRPERGSASEPPQEILAYPRPRSGPIPKWVDEDVHRVHFAARKWVTLDDYDNLTEWMPPSRLRRWA